MWKKSINVKCHLFSAQESTLTVGEKKNWGGKVCHVFPHFNIITVISRWQNYEILTMAEQTWLITTHGLVHAISHRASEVNFLCDTLSPLLLVPLHTKHPWHSFPHHHLTIYNFSLSFVGEKNPIVHNEANLLHKPLLLNNNNLCKKHGEYLFKKRMSNKQQNCKPSNFKTWE